MSGAGGSIVITGASRGLGAALALEFAAPGVTLGLIARGEAGLQAVAAACRARGATVRLAALDVQEEAAMAALLLAWDDAAPITLAVANAGVSAGTRPDGSPEGAAAALRQVRVNLLGALHLVEPLLPRLLARRGAVGLIGSLAGFRGLPDAPGYSASKAGLWAYGEALRAAHGPAGLQVTVVAPGFFDSAMSARVIGPRPLAVSQRAAAARVARALRRGAARAVFPWPLGLALRLLALLPPGLSDALARLARARVRPEEEPAGPPG